MLLRMLLFPEHSKSKSRTVTSNLKHTIRAIHTIPSVIFDATPLYSSNLYTKHTIYILGIQNQALLWTSGRAEEQYDKLIYIRTLTIILSNYTYPKNQ